MCKTKRKQKTINDMIYFFKYRISKYVKIFFFLLSFNIRERNSRHSDYFYKLYKAIRKRKRIMKKTINGKISKLFYDNNGSLRNGFTFNCD